MQTLLVALHSISALCRLWSSHNTHAHTHTHTYTYRPITLMHIPTTFLLTITYMHTYAYIHKYVHKNKHTYIHTHIHTVHTYTHTHTHTHPYTCCIFFLFCHWLCLLAYFDSEQISGVRMFQTFCKTPSVCGSAHRRAFLYVRCGGYSPSTSVLGPKRRSKYYNIGQHATIVLCTNEHHTHKSTCRYVK